MNTDRGLMLADADGENPRPFIEAGPFEYLGSPVWSSDGERVIYRKVGPFEVTIESRALDESTSTVLVRQRGSVIEDVILAFVDDLLVQENAGDERLIYAADEPAPRTDQNLWELPLDPETGAAAGGSRRLTDLAGFRFWTLSATADGSRLVFLNNRSQVDVWVGVLADGGRRLDDVKRLTLDDRNDRAWGWTADGSVVFDSDRNGTADIFIQGIDKRNADDLVTGTGEQTGAQLTPDGRSVLYWDYSEGPMGPRRLMRIPVEGGPTEAVLDTEGLAFFWCATAPADSAPSCLLLEMDLAAGAGVMSRLDPVAGNQGELWRFPLDPTTKPDSDLSPDGTLLAMVGHVRQPSIRISDALTGEVVRNLEVTGVPDAVFHTAAWAPDGSGLYLAGESTRSLLLVRVDASTGEGSVLRNSDTGFFDTVAPSPDGRRLAFGQLTLDANIWMTGD